ncbi:response regulator [candidate division WOR-3 bacterium]|nr:response regulator [candidate division WOR-3 bacterium]
MQKTKILFINDDLDFSKTNKTMLEQAGYEVIIEQSGKKGIDSVKRNTPDLIICDVMLPDINGFSVCRGLKEDPNYSSIPIILLGDIGASPDSYVENIAKGHKADCYLAKPVDSKKIIDAVNDLLTKTRSVPKEERVNPKILLVDDDPDFLEATKQILTANKYDVITAKNGDEGIAKAKYESPDLILLDVIMPGKDGFTVCYELRKIAQTRPIPIVMLTAVGQQLTKPEYAVDIAIDHLADDYIDKPVDMPTLLKKIEKHLLFR